ncbi:UxaA family hydrolase [Paenibacillus sp. WST5]|uniref:UxaA family hydrolase n=2 Tax=Paenibacillus sedimenti TaxID=2770274 RepID=A0A926QI16_9BACL|nr:UxaA family hydrolase [Paenibacillus sedimenti]
MAGDIHAGADALVVDIRDHVATALRDLAEGDTASIRLGEELISVKLLQKITFGHKIAIAPMAQGSEVRKYGEVIGRATEAIDVGMHVHVHNVEGIRGRGDQADREGQG